MMSSMDVEAIEEAFVRGDWRTAAAQSKQQLLLLTAARETEDTARHALLSIYLRSVFELGDDDEVGDAADLVAALAPLPVELSLQWITFLVAMERRDDALDAINALLQVLAASIADGGDSTAARQQYLSATELLVRHVLLPSDDVDDVVAYIDQDAVLDATSKRQLIESIQHSAGAMPRASKPLPTADDCSSDSDELGRSELFKDHEDHAAASASASASADSSDALALGAAALAAAAVAFGVYRNRDRLASAVSGIVPSVSQGLAALFET
ncbi:hypothetical protein P43SY_001371 [Pythium insidiosum]|uniref:Uncharacterized protein n=1 Tax=Pythium insidiosum TaxID=114742 RepID=A0AAD5QCT4_PYTIN|nr:hypothetical protein P43SY_001371 [Pythium insidiosum]